MKRVKIGCVGTNGHQIIGLLKGVEAAHLVGVAEFSDTHWAEYRKACPEVVAKAERFESLEDLLRKTDCELVSLCSARRDQQAKAILACLAAGRHVLAEKPLCTSIEDLGAIQRAAAKAGRRVWAMLPMIYAPIFQEFGEIVKRGEIGEVGHVFAQKSYKFGGKRPQDRGVDGGIIQAAIHAVSFIRSTTGLEFAEISAMESAVGNDKPGNLQVELAITARLSNGALCQIVSNYLNPGTAPWWGNDQLRIFGTRGMLEAVDGLTRGCLYLSRGNEQRDLGPQHSNYMPSLLAELRDGEPCALTMRDSIRCTKIVLEAQASATDSGKPRKLLFDD